MILITGASGKTGKAVLQALARRGAAGRALVHRPEQAAAALAAGAAETAVGDLLDSAGLERAMAGVDAVYLICPNMHPDEESIGMRAVDAAKSQGVSRIVYHSVLHPQTQEMPHHWNKLKVEAYLFTSGLHFTILQPCAYMQNILGYWNAILENGVYAAPYPPETRISIVDLEDVAAAAARVLTESGHTGAIYELAGPEALSQAEAAGILAEKLERPVRAVGLERTAWAAQARQGGMAPYAVETLEKMFTYYERCGFSGNPRVLEWLLERPATNFVEFIQRIIEQTTGERRHG